MPAYPSRVVAGGGAAALRRCPEGVCRAEDDPQEAHAPWEPLVAGAPSWRCAKGHSGVLCAVCAEGYTGSNSMAGSNCQLCSDGGVQSKNVVVSRQRCRIVGLH